jgi:cystathionine beta-lyase
VKECNVTSSGNPSDPLTQGGFETMCAHYGEHRLAQGGAVAPPLYQTSTFVYPDAAAYEGRDRPDSPYYAYTRRSNPTTAILESKLARLEQGNWARCFSSGMAAITCALGACVASGAHAVIVSGCYQPTRRYMTEMLDRFGVMATFVRGTKPEDFISAIRDETKLIYLESPTTGRFDVIELAPIVAAARERGIRTLFDNSWATPYFQRPLEMGIDLVLHSATKFIGGHSDTLGGVVVGRDEALHQKVAVEAELLGGSPDPFAAWLLLRGLRTLALRMEQHQRSGLALAHLLAEHPAVLRVYHPGLESNPGYAVGRRQMRGCSGLFSFALREQSREATNHFVDRLRLFSIGCSWGGYESLVVAGQSADLFYDDPHEPPWIIRLHAGLESTDDLLADLRQALEG